MKFDIYSGAYGDTPDKMKQLTALEAIARDAAADLLQGAAEYQIGGTLPPATGIAGPAPTQGLRV